MLKLRQSSRSDISRALRPLAIGAIALIAFGAAGVFAAIPDGAGVIHACYTSPDAGSPAGRLRVIDTALSGPAARCGKGEVALDWNQRGLPGPAGPAGPAGSPGPQGLPGVDGADGADGADPDIHWAKASTGADGAGSLVASSDSDTEFYSGVTGALFLRFPGVDPKACAIQVSSDGGFTGQSAFAEEYFGYVYAGVRSPEGEPVDRLLSVTLNCNQN